MKVSQNFELEEFVSRQTFELWKEKSIWFLDYRIISLAEFMLKTFKNEMIINDWHTGGKEENRGFRIPSITKTEVISQHNFGRAIDFTIKDINPEEVREYIRMNFPHLRLIYGIAAIETNINWVHVDCRNNNNSIKLIEFSKRQ